MFTVRSIYVFALVRFKLEGVSGVFANSVSMNVSSCQLRTRAATEASQSALDRRLSGSVAPLMTINNPAIPCPCHNTGLPQLTQSAGFYGRASSYVHLRQPKTLYLNPNLTLAPQSDLKHNHKPYPNPNHIA